MKNEAKKNEAKKNEAPAAPAAPERSLYEKLSRSISDLAQNGLRARVLEPEAAERQQNALREALRELMAEAPKSDKG